MTFRLRLSKRIYLWCRCCLLKYHHDGHNYYLYRKYRQGVSEEAKENFKEKILDHTLTKRDIDRVTERLGDDIAKVYGFSLPSPAKEYRKRSDAR